MNGRRTSRGSLLPRTLVRGLCVGLVCWCAGCSPTVTPPRSPPQPAVVYVCDYGYHSSLLLPVSRGVWVEYLYGDYNWAALDRTGPVGFVEAFALSQGATLGRRYVYEPGVERPVPMTSPNTQTAVAVDRAACARLVAALDRRWQAHAGLTVYDGQAGGYYVYVRDDEPYGLSHNCNRVTADWLGQLGCAVRGPAMLSHFTVERSPR